MYPQLVRAGDSGDGSVPLLTLAALMSSSAKHSAMVLMLRKAASRAPVQSSQMAWGEGDRKSTSGT